jgi:hypothetical protein
VVANVSNPPFSAVDGGEIIKAMDKPNVTVIPISVFPARAVSKRCKRQLSADAHFGSQASYFASDLPDHPKVVEK